MFGLESYEIQAIIIAILLVFAVLLAVKLLYSFIEKDDEDDEP